MKEAPCPGKSPLNTLISDDKYNLQEAKIGLGSCRGLTGQANIEFIHA